MVAAAGGTMSIELSPGFSFQPLPPIEDEAVRSLAAASPLGPLAPLAGKWAGQGFNVIWRPNHAPNQDRFLELNVTSMQLEFTAISGPIPNRGLLQPDMNMFGLTYLQQISDKNLNAGLHIEPGLFAAVPKTTDPDVPPTVVRLGSIPHGITQAMVDNPNSVLHTANAGQHITSTTTLHLSTTDLPVPGGGVTNTAFLKGGPHGPNARAAQVDFTLWLETIQGQTAPTQLQYTQTVLLNFSGLSWPHVTVGTLKKA